MEIWNQSNTRREDFRLLCQILHAAGRVAAAAGHPRRCDAWCPRCDGILDRFSHHAGLCLAGGDARAAAPCCPRRSLQVGGARWAATRERSPACCCPSGLRRWGWPEGALPTSLLTSVLPLDIAVTGPQRQETLAMAARKMLASAAAYAETKKSHLNTAELCQQQGVKFFPLVAETTKPWEPQAAKLLLHTSLRRRPLRRGGMRPASCRS